MIHLRTIAIILMTGLIIVGCGGETADPTATAAVELARTEAATSEPTALPTDVPTETAVPAATESVAVAPTETAAIPVGDGLFSLFGTEPVIRPVAADDGGIRYVAPGAVIEQDGRLHMFRGGFSAWPGLSEVAYYSSDDGYRWNREQGLPVLLSADVPIAEPGTMGHTGFVDSDGVWNLYFHTLKSTSSPGYIGRATAPAALGPWTAEAEPVVSPGSAGEWDDLRFVRPQVVETEGGYVMYYAAFDESGQSMIGLATSADAEVWTKYDDPATTESPFAESDPVLRADEDWNGRSLNRPAVAHSPEGWVMLYQSGTDYGLAFSEDGIAWTPYGENPVLTQADLSAALGSGASTLYQAALVYFEGTYFLYIEVGGSGGADIYLLTHEGLLREDGLETAEETLETEEALMEPLGPVRVETLVAELPAATGGVTVDQEGNIYVADIGAVPARLGETVYRITPAGEVSVFATGGGMSGASGNAFDSQGNLYQSNFTASTISKITPEGEVTDFTKLGLWGPVGIVIDETDTLFVANCIGGSVQMVTPEGKTSQFATSSHFSCPNGITMDEDHNLYVVNFSDGKVLKVTPEGEVSVLVTLPGGNNGHIVYAGNGIMYAIARGANQVYRVSTSGQFDLVAGTGESGALDGPGESATFLRPNGIALSPDGTKLYINEVHVSASSSENIPSTVRVIYLGGG